MAQWTISYNNDNNTSTLDIESADKPTMEQAVLEVLEWASRNLERGEFGDGEESSTEPAMRLLNDYGITITGIAAR
ncbi:hypothetical protein NA655_07595 [Pseudomonas kuykendallii]|uniref:Uncharacterized protein n=1 Tax=Pseudomonas kuykendallii TaxID=1007099 RepID=A0A1H2X677_9PSED|nr:hypothetical protein [Pseudomonas kuykendallii]MCQ4270879.1 hypothetical protein [Pseudomonas kuykendallii]SDW88403.1 hypothetical protein SAMN05216287_1792 [Pseudomonas kuykendallii]